MKFNHEKQQFEVKDVDLSFPLSLWKLSQAPDGTPLLIFTGNAPFVAEARGYTMAELEKLMKPPKKSRRKNEKRSS